MRRSLEKITVISCELRTFQPGVEFSNERLINSETQKFDQSDPKMTDSGSVRKRFLGTISAKKSHFQVLKSVCHRLVKCGCGNLSHF